MPSAINDGCLNMGDDAKPSAHSIPGSSTTGDDICGGYLAQPGGYTRSDKDTRKTARDNPE